MKAGGLLDLSWAREELADLERQRSDLAASIAATTREIEEQEARHIDLDGIEEALADFDRLWPHLTGPEAKELVGYIVREVRVHADGTMDVDLYEGRTLRASMPPKGKPRGGRAKRSDAGFVSGVEWLRRRDSNSRPGG